MFFSLASFYSGFFSENKDAFHLKKYKNTQFYILGCKIGCLFCNLLIFSVYCGETGTNNLFVVACHRIPLLLKHNTFKVNVALCNITQYHKTCIKSCTKPCTRNIQ
nr:MAG TPA: hypothetical protein [Caudoviricetes sp.]